MAKARGTGGRTVLLLLIIPIEIFVVKTPRPDPHTYQFLLDDNMKAPL